jgi:hypothetical protein
MEGIKGRCYGRRNTRVVACQGGGSKATTLFKTHSSCSPTIAHIAFCRFTRICRGCFDRYSVSSRRGAVHTGRVDSMSSGGDYSSGCCRGCRCRGAVRIGDGYGLGLWC